MSFTPGAVQFQLRPLVIEACASFEQQLSAHGDAIAELRDAGVSERRIQTLYPLDVEDYRAAVENRLQTPEQVNAYLSGETAEYLAMTDLLQRMPPDLRWVNPKLATPLSRYQRLAEGALNKIVLLHNVQRWFEFDYMRSLPTLGEQMWASRALRDLKADGEHVGRFIQQFGSGLGLPPFTNAPS